MCPLGQPSSSAQAASVGRCRAAFTGKFSLIVNDERRRYRGCRRVRGLSMADRGELVAELCRQSEDVLASLKLPAIFTLAQLHEQIQHTRRRRVHLVPRHMPDRMPCGVWIAAHDEDYVFYDAASSAVHQQMIIAHEFGHMLFDDPAPARFDELIGMLMPDIDTSVVTRLVARSGYQEYREQRAEIFGSIVVSRMGHWGEAQPLSRADPAVLARIVAALEAARR